MTDRLQQTATYVVCFDAETGVATLGPLPGRGAPTEVDNLRWAWASARRLPAITATGCSPWTGPIFSTRPTWARSSRWKPKPGWSAGSPAIPVRTPGGRGKRPRLEPGGLPRRPGDRGPSDAAAIYAFDAESGRLVWKTDPIAEEVKLAHLLGVAKGRLVATGDRVLLFDVKTGKLAASWPESGKSEGYGRGLLAGERIYWPTRDRIEVLDQGSGLRAEPPIKLMELYLTTGGNLVAGNGYLIVAQADALVVFCQNSRLIERYRDEIARDPSRPRRTIAWPGPPRPWAATSCALESYEQAAAEARPGRDDRRQALWPRRRAITSSGCSCGWPRPHAARRSSTRPQPSLETAARIARSDGDRLRARLLLADLELEADQPAARSRSSAGRSSTRSCAV